MKDCLLHQGEQVLETLKSRSPMESINVFRLNEKAILPTRTNPTDAGLDLYASENVFIKKGETGLIKTDISVRIPPGYVGKIEDRSSMAVKGLRTGAGIIDAGYNGEVKIVLHNISNNDNSITNGYLVQVGQKIAQLLIYKVETPEVLEVDISWDSQRGNKGFGSSGV